MFDSQSPKRSTTSWPPAYDPPRARCKTASSSYWTPGVSPPHSRLHNSPRSGEERHVAVASQLGLLVRLWLYQTTWDNNTFQTLRECRRVNTREGVMLPSHLSKGFDSISRCGMIIGRKILQTLRECWRLTAIESGMLQSHIYKGPCLSGFYSQMLPRDKGCSISADVEVVGKLEN